MCGKYQAFEDRGYTSEGSPPHVREIPKEEIEDLESIRITPACAGNTSCKLGNALCPRDHPRMCGKYFSWQLLHRLIKGSPPHVREIRKAKSDKLMALGITPACAGNTFRDSFYIGSLKDHPRMCGKYPRK